MCEPGTTAWPERALPSQRNAASDRAEDKAGGPHDGAVLEGVVSEAPR